MDASTHTVPPSRIHLRALGLAAILFAVFTTATGLYARYGYAVVLRVYEEYQVWRAEERVGSGKLVELGDYLCVDPANLRVRGLLVNQWIEFKDPGRAYQAAREGLSVVTPEQRPIAMLLVARAQIASGSLKDAAETYREVLSAVGESCEAHYGLAHIAAAKGEFEQMRIEYEECKRFIVSWPGSTPDFIQRATEALRSTEWNTTPPLYANSDDAFFVMVSLYAEILGNIGFTDPLKRVVDFKEAPPFALFLRGVSEELGNNRDAALDFYQRAAAEGDALGAYAHSRLGRAPAN